MAIYEYTSEKLNEISETEFKTLGIKERADLQRLLRDQIEIVAPECLVISEEFGDWEEGNRRIDLLAVDRDANLVVIELKRTEDGGHMELQAIRYAAMVSTMTFEQAVKAYENYLGKRGLELDAESTLLEFLAWESSDEEEFGVDVRILLVSSNFSKELTTAVIWLLEREIDICCVRLVPFKREEQILIDVQQIIPLPEAEAFQVHVREKERAGRKKKSERYSIRKQFWTGLLKHANTKTDLFKNISPGEYHWQGAGSGVRGVPYTFKVNQNESFVELYIDRGKNGHSENEQIFDFLHQNRESIETAFGEPLIWLRLDGKRACAIRHIIKSGGYRSDVEQWPGIHEEMAEAMIRFEKAVSPRLQQAVNAGINT